MNNTYITKAGKFQGKISSSLVTLANGYFEDTFQMIQYQNDESIITPFYSQGSAEWNPQFIY